MPAGRLSGAGAGAMLLSECDGVFPGIGVPRGEPTCLQLQVNTAHSAGTVLIILRLFTGVPADFVRGMRQVIWPALLPCAVKAFSCGAIPSSCLSWTFPGSLRSVNAIAGRNLYVSQN
jgi:hypothetical protein